MRLKTNSIIYQMIIGMQKLAMDIFEALEKSRRKVKGYK